MTLREIKKLQNQIKELKKQLEPAIKELKERLANRKTPIKEGAYKAELQIVNQNRLDTATLKAEKPKVYEAYLMACELQKLIIV